MRGLLRLAYAPAMLLGFIGGAIWLVATGRPAWVLAPLLMVAILLSFLPNGRRPTSPNGTRTRATGGATSCTPSSTRPATGCPSRSSPR